MHRLLTTTENLELESPQLSREALNHLKVLRPRDGEEIELFDGRGSSRIFSYAREKAALVACGKPRVHKKRLFELTLFACVTKGSRWDWTIEKATELGVSRLVPVISERTIVRIPSAERAAKRARWMRIAEEAARQSDAAWLPEIVEPLDFADSLALVRETQCFVGALTNPPPQPLLTAARAVREASDAVTQTVTHPALYVGPEGDFTSTELESLLQIATPTSFGPTILRAETAAIFGISLLAALSGASPNPNPFPA